MLQAGLERHLYVNVVHKWANTSLPSPYVVSIVRGILRRPKYGQFLL